MLSHSRRCSTLKLKTYIKLPSKKSYSNLVRVVLQRQFFEAIVRSASVKFSNRSDLPTLSEKLESLFKTKLNPNATKNKAKSVEDEVRLKVILNLSIETIQDC